MIERIEWLIEGRVVHVLYTGIFTLEDMKAASRHIEILVEQEGHEPGVHVIQDAYHSAEVHKSVFNFGEVQRTTYKHVLIQWTIVVDPALNPVLQFIGTTLAQIFKTKFRVVKTLDDAKDALRRADLTLRDHPALYPANKDASGGGM